MACRLVTEVGSTNSSQAIMRCTYSSSSARVVHAWSPESRGAQVQVAHFAIVETLTSGSSGWCFSCGSWVQSNPCAAISSAQAVCLRSKLQLALAGLVEAGAPTAPGRQGRRPPIVAATAALCLKLSPPLWAMARRPGHSRSNCAKSLTTALRMLVSDCPRAHNWRTRPTGPGGAPAAKRSAGRSAAAGGRQGGAGATGFAECARSGFAGARNTAAPCSDAAPGKLPSTSTTVRSDTTGASPPAASAPHWLGLQRRRPWVRVPAGWSWRGL